METQLSTADSKGKRLWVYPADVYGRFRRRRDFVSFFLLVIFLLLPWFKIGGQQALLLDFWHGRFSIFGLGFWAHDIPMLAFVLMGAVLSLAFVTATWGRAWCGWGCPQTIFVDSVFRRIERWIEGDAVTRRKFDSMPLSVQKVQTKAFKWTIFLFISLVISHSFIAYFVGASQLRLMLSQPPSAHYGAFGAMALISAAVLFDFGWLREQFCTLLCPYGRFQSALMDDRSLVIAFDRTRGDCVSCNRCVQVCPTGIDIRNGLQLECVACTACIDACDTVMDRLKKPRGLIRYQRVAESVRGILSVRGAILLGALFVLGAALVVTLVTRSDVDVTFIRKVGAPYQEIVREGFQKEIVNHFRVDLSNQTLQEALVSLALADSSSGARLVGLADLVKIPPGESRKLDFFVQFPTSTLIAGVGRLKLDVKVAGADGRSLKGSSQEVSLVGPL